MPRDNETARWIRNEADNLADAGYSGGVTLPLVDLSPIEQRTVATSNTTYTDSNSVTDHRLQFDKLVPDGQDVQVMVGLRVSPGTDETVDVRVQDVLQNDVMLERTGITSSGNNVFGWDTFTPSDPSSTSVIRAQLRTDPGTNSSSIQAPIIALGIEL